MRFVSVKGSAEPRLRGKIKLRPSNDIKLPEVDVKLDIKLDIKLDL